MGRRAKVVKKHSTKEPDDRLRAECDLGQLRGGVPGRCFLRATASAKVRPAAIGSVPGLNYDNIGELLEQLEGPLHR
jgi:hypothetical protein